VYSLSRLARSTRDAIDIAERLAKSGADLVSITEKIDTTTSMGRFFFTTIAALAQLERDQISERTRMALAHKRALGQRIGGRIPYGFKLADDGVKLLEEPGEQRALATIQQIRSAGGTTRDIEKELQRQGVRPRSGWHWHPKVLLDLCRRKSHDSPGSPIPAPARR
jgi:site-specific DNA recombinase